jgi:hypothetical protein
MDERVFTVEIGVQEEPGHTLAKALLDLDGRVLGGWGRARRNPADAERPRLGKELAVARALADLAHQLGADVDAQIETAEGKPAHVHL